MARMTAKEIDQHYKDDYSEEEADHDQELRFQEPEHDECIEPEYDPRQDDWLFDDYDPWADSVCDDLYDEPYPNEDDYLFS